MIQTLVMPRGSGKTTMLAELAKSEPGALVVCPNAEMAKRMVRLHGVPARQVRVPHDRPLLGMSVTRMLVDDLDVMPAVGANWLRYVMERVPVLATASPRPKQPFRVPKMTEPHEVIRFVMRCEGVEPDAIATWADPTRMLVWVEAQWRENGVSSAVKVSVTAERRHRTRPDVLWVDVGLKLAAYRKRMSDQLRDVDAVETAVHLIGFERHEVKRAAWRREGVTVLLDVDVAGSEWEPSFEVDAADLERMRRLMLPLSGLANALNEQMWAVWAKEPVDDAPDRAVIAAGALARRRPRAEP